MAYYLPLGPRGLVLRFGTMILGVFGGLIYWRASRRRALVPIPVHEPIRIGSEH